MTAADLFHYQRGRDCCGYFFFSSRRRHTRWPRDWSSDVCSSDLVGTSGRSSERVAVLTASARSLPVLTYSIEDGSGSNVTCTRPPMRSASAGGTPRYDTCTRSTPAMILNSSPQTCWIDPGPADAMLISPGWALA